MLNTSKNPYSPESSFWVSASAGTGKTKLLTERVLRLLMEGVLPQKILCLTFTKAAAAEMMSRITETLSSWIFIEDEKLLEKIKQLGVTGNLAEIKTRCRTLFADIIDKNESIRIQTIHAFCQSILGRFPLESGVRPNFKVIDERTAAEMLKEARLRLLQNKKSEDIARSLSIVATETSDNSLDETISKFINKFASIYGKTADSNKIIDSIYEQLSINKFESKTYWLERLGEFDANGLKAAAEALFTGSDSDVERAKTIVEFLANPGIRALKYNDYIDVFLTQEGKPKANLITKDALKKNPVAKEILVNEQSRVLKISEKIKLHNIAELTTHLIKVCSEIMILYEDLKQTRATLDYNDLIVKTSDILSNSELAPWIMYKLDGGIEHIFVDEAQDTGPHQWNIIVALLSEFFAGQGSSPDKTVFVVGDEKQSIYSFQGADHRYFGLVRKAFTEKAKGSGKSWEHLALQDSYRTSEPVLKFVDKIFEREDLKRNVTDSDAAIKHTVTRKVDGGVVEVWPQIAKEKSEELKFVIPDKRYQSANNQKILADMIAEKIDALIKSGKVLSATKAKITAGDILILVRKRSEFNRFLEKALKEKNINVAGADRQELSENVTFHDLISLVKFASLPEDDLNLAALLKSPFFNFTEEELFEASYNRAGSIYSELKNSSNEKFTASAKELAEIYNLARNSRLLEFYEYILSVKNFWQKIFARNGVAAQTVVNEVLNLVETYEASHTPTLDGFVKWITSGSSEVKSEMKVSGDEVRIMTVHGSKGLQAPIVFIADSSDIPAPKDQVIWAGVENNIPLWVIGDNSKNPTMDNIKSSKRAQVFGEYIRLLYVALTRAKDELYITGWQARSSQENNWHNIALTAAKDICSPIEIKVPGDNPEQKTSGFRLEKLANVQEAKKAGSADKIIFPEYFNQKINKEELAEIIHPSTASESLSVLDIKAATRGKIIHKFFENYSLTNFDKNFNYALKRFPGDFSENEIQQMRNDIKSAITTAEFEKYFGSSSQAEISLAGRVGRKQVIGTIDRVNITDSEIFLLEIKTDRKTPASINEIRESYLLQIYYYAELLRKIYPSHKIHPAFLWVSKPAILPLSFEELEARIRPLLDI